jgi:hypothetical protein
MPTKLDHTNKQLPFEPPYAYFENFENRLKARLEAETQQPRLWWQQARWKVALATVILVAASWFFNRQLDAELSLAEIPVEEKVDYLYTYTDTYFTLLAGDEELDVFVENDWITPEEAEQFLETENLEILMTEL